MSVDTDRRSAVKVLLGAALSALLARPARGLAPSAPRIGIALGSGGARGLAHVLMLEVFDELGLRPHRIAGSSIGAVMGALYASGLSAAEIGDIIDGLTVSRDESWFDALFNEDLSRWAEFIEPTLRRGGLIGSDAFINFLRDETGCSRFEDLKTPLQVVATDFWSREQVVFDSSELWPTVRASMAMPGLFTPVPHQGRVLVDGGLVNPVPYDLLFADCDITVAVDVLGIRTPAESLVPSYFETSFNTFQIMQTAIVQAKLARQRPDILLRPDIRDVPVLAFYRFQEIFRQAIPERNRLRRELRVRLGGSASGR